MAASSKRKVHNGNENVGSNPTLPTNLFLLTRMMLSTLRPKGCDMASHGLDIINRFKTALIKGVGWV